MAPIFFALRNKIVIDLRNNHGLDTGATVGDRTMKAFLESNIPERTQRDLWAAACIVAGEDRGAGRADYLAALEQLRSLIWQLPADQLGQATLWYNRTEGEPIPTQGIAYQISRAAIDRRQAAA